MLAEYHFFKSFGDPSTDALAKTYQTPFYIGTIAERHVESYGIEIGKTLC